MARFTRERFDKNRPLVAIRALTLNGEFYEIGDPIPMDTPEGLRKKMWKARRIVHDGAPIRGKSTPNNKPVRVNAKAEPKEEVKPKSDAPKKRGRPAKFSKEV